MSVSPPRPKDLPLTALRAFEAAARLGGFAAAGQELNVTPGAITAHIKGLEAELGAALFERTPRGVHLTAVGESVLPDFTAAFDALGVAVQSLRQQAAPSTVHIATLPALAQFWLSPRLPALRAVAPEISISITALEAPPYLKRSPFDLCLFFGANSVTADRGLDLGADILFPVCAPALAERLQHPEDLLTVPCLSDAVWSDDWAHWTRQAMPGTSFTPRGPVYSLYALAVEETINGAGVLMGHHALVAPHLERGSLVAPFDTVVSLTRHLLLWSAKPLRKDSAARRVVQWLQDNR